MNTLKAMKFVPMSVMLAALACATYAVQPEGPDFAPVDGSTATKPAATAGKMSVHDGAEGRATSAPAEPARAVRDPFQVASAPGRAGAGPEQADVTPDRTDVDPHIDLVQGLTLNGTFLQGRTRIAIIDGRIHEKGQNLRGPGDEPSPLVVAEVLATGVILQGQPGGKRYVLSYPDGRRDAGPGSKGARRAAGQGRVAQGAKTSAGRGPIPHPPAMPSGPALAGSPLSLPRRPANR